MHGIPLLRLRCSKDKEAWLIMDLDSGELPTAAAYEWQGMKDGMRAAVSLAGLVMACSFVGYGAFLHSISFGLLPGLFATLVIWFRACGAGRSSWWRISPPSPCG